MNIKCTVRYCILGLLVAISVFFLTNTPAIAHTDPTVLHLQVFTLR